MADEQKRKQKAEPAPEQEKPKRGSERFRELLQKEQELATLKRDLEYAASEADNLRAIIKEQDALLTRSCRRKGRVMFHRIICSILGHRFYIVKRFSTHSRKVCCRRCGSMWGMNDNARAFIPWDYELEEFHSSEGGK